MMPGLSGEISPGYAILDHEDIQKMYDLAPDAKVIFLIRNPIHRAWSSYRFNERIKKKGEEPPIEEASAAEIIRFIDSERQEKRSDYLQTIQKYTTTFPKNQIIIGFYDAIKSDPVELLSEIVHFIGGNGEPSVIMQKCPYSSVINPSQEMVCPPEARAHLQSKYKQKLRQMAISWGSYCVEWYENTYGETLSGVNRELTSVIFLK